jgi:hypothetical protein
MMKADTRELQKLERTLLDLNRRALPFATQHTVNGLAFESQGQWRKALPGKLQLRGKWTESSIRVDKSQGLNIAAQQASVGSVADYMGDLEAGVTEHKKGKHGVPVPGAPLGRRRMPKAHHLGAIKILPRVTGHRSRQVAASLAMARKRGGEQFAFLKLKRGKEGIYKLDPSKKKLAVRKVWSLSKKSVTVPAHPTMGPAVQGALSRGSELYRKALEFQLRRLGMQGSL